MSWYKTGTVKTTINSNAIIGTGTAFISNSRVGDAFRGPDGNWYEVTNIASNTAMSISPNYQGPTVAAGTYSIAPMQGYVKESADALRAASLVIGNTATDMSDQVNAAKASATDALASKNEASASAKSAALSAATATTKAAEAASRASTATTQAGIATTQATAATTQADRAKTGADSAALSAQRAETAAGRTANKASSGANSDITSLSGLTTPLSVSQGGTGGNSVASARKSLNLVPVNNDSDTTVGSLVTPGWMGFGGALRVIPKVNFNDLPPYSFTFIGRDALAGPDVGDFYITHEYLNSNNANVTATSLTTGKKYSRTNRAGWTSWTPSTASWGSISGSLSAQTDLQGALNTKALLPTSGSFAPFSAVSASAVLPTGGTWAYWVYQANHTSGALTGTCSAGVAAGGTTVKQGASNVYIFGFCWRIA